MKISNRHNVAGAGAIFFRKVQGKKRRIAASEHCATGHGAGR
jgi:hypothetical protein